MVSLNWLMSAVLLTGMTVAHPGEPHDPEQHKRALVARDFAAKQHARSYSQCSNSPRALEREKRAISRRMQKVNELRNKRGIKSIARKAKRDLEDLQSWEAINHNKTGSLDYDMFTPIADIFGANTSCILAPETTNGPYYIVGEYMRSNVKESLWSEGVDLFLEIQYIDVNTCEPIPTVAVDIWNCNATGIYSGIYTDGNYAEDGVNSTYLRGIQLTDHDGVVQFETIFPGHYDGRATHTHILAHINGTLSPNGTIQVWDAPMAHNGQLFWPEDLRDEVEATYPYTLNTQSITTNDEDMWTIVQADESYDPFPQFVYLGDSIEDGLFAWIQIGLNATADYTEDDYYSIAGYLDETGGHALGGQVGGSPGEGGPGNGTGSQPSGTGAPPSGTGSTLPTSSETTSS
ncbi:hypothetical protein V2G26_011060 [Clonostachys chloroleuca]